MTSRAEICAKSRDAKHAKAAKRELESAQNASSANRRWRGMDAAAPSAPGVSPAAHAHPGLCLVIVVAV